MADRNVVPPKTSTAMWLSVAVTHSHLYATVGCCVETLIDLSMVNDSMRYRQTDGEDCCT
ncbi:hypothetical protein KIN20_018877 [Parelaphostrongylus tenuis]|uniref:Uncharacterized protein n=1 Tax=Parelaphostrongylus tenuis TaxID=148309 RepID=A0AAD5N483_PARTN|nr:hypothetical protein KIN20_018877 [Parelaphostrongylus tenuis]